MSGKTIRYAIVGAGNIARVHTMACKELGDVELVAIVDTDADRAESFARNWGYEKWTTNLEQLVELGLDVVGICTPHPTHAALIERIAALKLNIMVEKPLDVNLARSRAALKAADLHGVKIGVIFQRRYWPAAQRIKALTTGAAFGDIVQGECIVHFSRTQEYFSPARSAWRGRWETEGGGVLVNQASHAIDMFQWLMGPIEGVYAQWTNLTHPGVEVDTSVAATLRFANGALGVVSLALNPRQSDQSYSQISIYGSSGQWASVREEPEGSWGLNVNWDVPGESEAMAERTAKERAEDKRMYRIVENGLKPPIQYGECHRLQYADFFSYLRDGTPYDLTGWEGIKTVEIIEAIYESARRNSLVSFPLQDREVISA